MDIKSYAYRRLASVPRMTVPEGDRSAHALAMNPAILTYLRQRQAQLCQELGWLKDRIVQGVDPDEADEAIVEALGAELAQVTMLLEGREPRTRLH